MAATKLADFYAHLTLVDIHDATIARDLCMFMLLHQLNATSDETVRTEIKATLMYAFCGAVMPSYCYQRLKESFRDITARLTSDPPDIPRWMHVSLESLPAIVDALEFWITATRSTRDMLAHHTIPQKRGEPVLSGRKTLFNDGLADERKKVKAFVLNMSGAQILKAGFVAPNTPPDEAVAQVRRNIDRVVDTIVSCPVPQHDRHIKERLWYAQTKVFLPPEELRLRHPDFDIAWVQVQNARKMEIPDLAKVNVHIERSWQPNITLIDRSFDDPHCDRHENGYPDLSEQDLFEAINVFEQFNVQIHTSSGDARTPSGRWLDKHKSSAGGVLAWDVCNYFFEQAAAALKSLNGKITLEFLIGDICEQFAKMRCGDDRTRPAGFPRKFTRIWLSNVPDYTHGPLNVILYVAPNLQDRSYAGVACNSLLNTSAWRDDEEFFHTYTLLKIKDIPRYLGCTLLNSNAVMEIILLGPSPSLPRPLSELATREEVTTWLTRVLFNTFIPGRSEPVIPCDTRLPHNLVAFFGLLMYLHRIGYPGHWLSDFLARVLSGRMLSDVVPYTGEYPIPVGEYTRRVPARAVRTDPWLVEFETIIATAYYAIPFPVASALPADFSRDAEDIVVWEVPVRPTQRFLSDPGFYGVQYHPVTHLLFFRADKLSADEVIRGMREIFEGRSSLTPGIFFVLTSQEHVMYRKEIRFRLSKSRVERMRSERWAVVAYRNDVGLQATVPVSIKSWTALLP